MINLRTVLPRLAVLGCLALGSPAFAQYSSPMRDVDNGARQPANFFFLVGVPNGQGQASNQTAVTIPAGKRLVIETISYTGQVVSGEIGFLNVATTSGVGTTAGATYASHVIPMFKLTTVAPSWDFIGGLGVFRMYADAASTVLVTYNRGTFSAGVDNIYVTITGHYVNLP
jgi:hypothetical protein